jgi:hypothetical protein
MERMDEPGDQRTNAVVGVLADVNDLIGTAAIVLSLEQDNGLQRELRRCAQVQDDRVLVVQLPIGGAGMELLPRGGTRPLRIDALRGAVSLEQLALENVTIQDRLRAKGSSVLQAFEAFRADPTLVDRRGEMIGLAALPAILAAQPSFAYPSRATRSHALLPAIEEMGEIFRRAWAVDETAATIH